MSEKFDKIRFLYHYTQGYGGPDLHEVRVVYDNRELEKIDCGSDKLSSPVTLEC